MEFFLPWKKTVGENVPKTRKIVIPKQRKALEDSAFNNSRAPYFSLPNPSGIVRSFLTALEKDREEEALGYLSASVSSLADMGQMKKLFGEKKEILFFSEESKDEERTVSLACGSGEWEIISLHMVAEPDHFGKWKIYSIEKE